MHCLLSTCHLLLILIPFEEPPHLTADMVMPFTGVLVGCVRAWECYRMFKEGKLIVLEDFIAHRQVQNDIRLSTYIRIASVLGCCLLFRCSIHDVRTSLMFVQNFVGLHQCISYPSNTSWDKADLDNSSCTGLTMQQQPALFLRMPEPNCGSAGLNMHFAWLLGGLS